MQTNKGDSQAAADAPDLSVASVDGNQGHLIQMGGQLGRRTGTAPTLVAGGRAGQPCGQPNPALNTVVEEQENTHVPN